MNDRPCSALLSFRVENFRSFRDEVELSLLATKLSSPSVPREIQWGVRPDTIEILPVACILGANASGKTNILRALATLRTLVASSFRSSVLARLYDPFQFSKSSTAPIRFSIDLVVKGTRYLYEVGFDQNGIQTESAYYFPKGRSKKIFERIGSTVNSGSESSKATSTVASVLRDDALFLSVAAALNHPLLTDLAEWFDRLNLAFADESTRPLRQHYTASRAKLQPTRSKKTIDLIRAADLGINDLTFDEIDIEDLDPETDDENEQEYKRRFVAIATELNSLKVSHKSNIPDDAWLPFNEESLGTKVWVGLVGPILDALESGAILLADELDASLHPALVRKIVELFQDPDTNPNRAQLVFNSHDVTLLDNRTQDWPLGRDQIWLADKSETGESTLTPLSDFKVRTDENLMKRYMSGMYGGMPFLTSYDFEQAVISD